MTQPFRIIRKGSRRLENFGRKQFMNPLVRRETGFVPIENQLEEDIFIVGYPKSGNTWFQTLVAGVQFGVNPLYVPDSLVQELVPDVHFKRYYKRFWTPMCFKTHYLPRPLYQRVIYLIRDGRDAMVSYYHFLRAINEEPPSFAEMVKSGEGIYCKWHTHVDSWLANPHHAEMIVIKYEDLKQYPVRELKRFCEFARLERDETWLNIVADNASFEKAQEKEKAGKAFWDNAAWPADKLFTRRGVVGSYKDEMPPEVLEIFMAEAGSTLQEYGYR